jgi:hypothetical protein
MSRQGALVVPELLAVLTGVVIVVVAARAYWLTRDPFHPMVFMTPAFLFIFVVRPLTLLLNGQMRYYMPDNLLLLPFLYRFAGCSIFCFGTLLGLSRFVRQGVVLPETILSSEGRRRAYLAACLLGMGVMGSFVWTLHEGGGFYEMYSHAYGGHHASSGYISMGNFLGMPAVLLVAVARQRRKLRFTDVVVSLLLIAPLMIFGLLGGRRGPAFASVATLVLGWYTFQSRRPALKEAIVVIAVLVLIPLFLAVYRTEVYIGSSFSIDPEQMTTYVAANRGDVGVGDDAIYPYATIAMMQEYQRHTWGVRILVNFLIRPIPRQLWRAKYADTGLGFLDENVAGLGYSYEEWARLLKCPPPRGSAFGFDVEMFTEFSWGGLLGCYVLGWFVKRMWFKYRRSAGVWQLLYPVLLGFSLHLPTQGATPTLVPWCYAAIPTILLWNLLIGKYTVRVRPATAALR